MTESQTSPSSNMWMWLLSHDIFTRILLLLETWQCHRHRFTCKCWGSVLVRFQVVLSDIWLDLFGKSSKGGASRPAGALEAAVCVACLCCRENYSWASLSTIVDLILLTVVPVVPPEPGVSAEKLPNLMVFSDTLSSLGRKRLWSCCSSFWCSCNGQPTWNNFITSLPVWISAPNHQSCATQVGSRGISTVKQSTEEVHRIILSKGGQRSESLRQFMSLTFFFWVKSASNSIFTSALAEETITSSKIHDIVKSTRRSHRQGM